MNGFKLLLVIASLVLCGLPAGLCAQGIVDKLPQAYTVDGINLDADERSPARVLERFEAELAEGRYLAVLSALAEESRTTLGRHGREAGGIFQMKFDELVARFRGALHEAALEERVETEDERSAVLAAMGDRGAESLRPSELISPMGAAEGSALFAGTDHEILLYEQTDDGKFRLLVPRDIVVSMRLRGDAVYAVLMDFVDPVQRAQFAAIKRANRKWEGYLEDGYSQYPWETLLNGWLLNFSAFNPPDKQWILAHPSLAVEASTFSLDEVTAKEVLNLELLGFLGYYGDRNQHYLGFSVATILRDDLRPGIGPVLHWSKNFSLGVAWHDIDGNDKLDDDHYVFFSLDFFRFFQSAGPRFKQEYDKLKAYLN